MPGRSRPHHRACGPLRAIRVVELMRAGAHRAGRHRYRTIQSHAAVTPPAPPVCRPRCHPGARQQKAQSEDWAKCLNRLVGAAGFELATPCTPCKCATRLRYAPTQERDYSIGIENYNSGRRFFVNASIRRARPTGFRGPRQCLPAARRPVRHLPAREWRRY